jgi:hypothetical protein
MRLDRSQLPFRFTTQLINLITIILGIAAAYFMTIQSLKVELAAKAESAVVAAMDRRMAAFEVLLKEGVVGKEQFFEFSTDVEARLIRIEQYLKNNPGEEIGRR